MPGALLAPLDGMRVPDLFRVVPLLLLATGAAQDRNCDGAGPQTEQQNEVRPPGDRGANEGAQGKVNAIVEEQENAAGPQTTRKPNLP
jgi:hypothetical protein